MSILVALIPFELRYTLLGVSNLQWAFIALALVSLPSLFRHWRKLKDDRLVQAAAIFVVIQWAAAAYAPEFHTNALKGAIRFAAGFVLLTIARLAMDRDSLMRQWSIVAGVAALYALIAHAGLGFPQLFRDEEFYIGQVRRLSGSFEYPNTAAVYFAMSLPIVWWSSLRPALKWVCALLLWAALILTFSKGALAAVCVVVAGVAIFEWRKTAPLLAAAAAAYAALLPVNPYLIERFRGPGVHNPIAVKYDASWNELRQQPKVPDEIPLHIQNTGVSKWRARGWWRVAISYRWLERESLTFLPANKPFVSELPRDIDSGQTVDVTARFQTPGRPGKYILVFELFSRDYDWFSRTGVVPILIEADIQPSVRRSVAKADLSHWYRQGQPAGLLTASVPRSSLWRAALKMFLDHPFGVGPDNYRLLYGKYLGASKWDTHVYANSLYLEVLTGSGILGLAAFLLMIGAIPWRLEPVHLALAVFLIHGLVDVFLMATPIYFAFWILVGLTRAKANTVGLQPLIHTAATLAEEPQNTG